MMNWNLELALNLMWVAASAMLILSCVRAEFRIQAKHRRLIIAVALVALICFLFPVISITDDLNSGSVYAESPRSYEWSSGVHHVAALWYTAVDVYSPETVRYATDINSVQDATQQSDAFSFNLSRRPPPQLT